MKILYCGAALLYLLCVNAYLAPMAHDNIIYYLLAKFLAQTGTFPFWGIPEWGVYEYGMAPLFPTLLALPFAIGLDSIVFLKLIPIAATLLSLYLFSLLLKREQRDHIFWLLAFFAFSPHTVLYTTRLFSESTYTVFTLLFLLALEKEKRQTLPLILCFSAAFLTRFIALTLLIPLFVICVRNWRKRKTLPFAETITLIFGIVFHFSWKVFVLWIQETSTNPVGFNFSPAFERFTHFNLAENLWLIADFFFYIHLIEKEPGLLSVLIGGITLGILLLGFFSRQRRPSDWYALGTLVVVFFFRWKFSRYLLPITPFLFSYLFSGIRYLRPLAPLWISAFLILNGIYLAIGNGGRTYNSMNPWLLGDRPFYGGIWRQTDQVCQSLSGQPKIRVVSALYPRDYDKYVHYFSHCEITEDPAEADFTLSINELASGTSEVFLY